MTEVHSLALTYSQLLDKVDDAIEASLLGQDVMFEGERITMANLDTLMRVRDRLKKKVRAEAGSGMMISNVGIKKRN